MQNYPIRHLDKGDKGIFSYIAIGENVICPRCQQVAWMKNGRFVCQHCQLELTTDLQNQLTTHMFEQVSGGRVYYFTFKPAQQLNWFGDKILFKNQLCEKCGSALLSVLVPAQSDETRITTVCSKCNFANKNSLTIGLYHRFNGENYHFALPLFLQQACKYGVLWAYNKNHLDDLRAFVQADLRERTIYAGNGSLFSRLPQWIKLAKNRELVLNLIEKLEQKYYSEFNQ